MSGTITLPSALARHTDGQSIISTDESSLGQALKALSNQYSLGDAILNSEGQLQPYIRVVISNKMLGKSQLGNPDEVALDGTMVELKTAFAGG